MAAVWCNEKDVLFSTQAGDYLRAAGRKMLSKRVFFTFEGYAVSQKKRMLRENMYAGEMGAKRKALVDNFIQT